MDSSELDEAQDRVGGDRVTGFVIVQRPERDSERLGEERAAVLAVERDPDLTESHREIGLDRLPVGVRRDVVQLWAPLYGRGRGSPCAIHGDYAPDSPAVPESGACQETLVVEFRGKIAWVSKLTAALDC